MVLELLKNLKQAAITHSLSAVMVVQGVAVQQATISDFSLLESDILEISSEAERSPASQANDSNEKYWQDLEVLASANEAEIASVSQVASLFENEDYSDNSGELAQENNTSSPQVNSSSSSLVAVASRAPAVAVVPSSGERVKAPKVSPSVAPIGSANNLAGRDKAKESRAVAALSDNVSSGPTALTRSEPASSSVNPIVSSSDSSSGESSGSADQGEGESDNQDDTPAVYEYLGSLALVVDGEVSSLIVEDQMVLELEEGREYSLQLVIAEDFGSLAFNIENTDISSSQQSVENHLPFCINGESGPNNTPRAYDFEAANYQLDLTAYDSNGQGGEVLERRTVRFSVVFIPAQNNDSDD